MSNNPSNLNPVRQKIDSIDKMLFTLLLERLECSQQVAAIKKETNKDVFDARREEEIIAKLEGWIEEEELTEHKNRILQLWSTMLELSRDIQNK